MRQMPQRIRELIDELVIDRQLVTGAALALRGRRWDATYCCGDNGAGVPMSEDALFDLASVTKLFTAEAMAKKSESVDVLHSFRKYRRKRFSLSYKGQKSGYTRSTSPAP